MVFNKSSLRIVILVSLCLLTLVGLCYAAGYISPGPVAANKAGTKLYVTAFDAGKLIVFDTAKGKSESSIALGASPTGVAVSPAKAEVYVTLSGNPGRLAIVSTAAGKVVGSVPTGHTPVAPVLSRDGKVVYVCDKFNDRVSVVSLSAKKVVARIPAVREPAAAALTPDGKTLVVANLLPRSASISDVVAASVTLIDTATNKVSANVRLLNGSTSLRGVTVSPDGQYAYVTHLLGRYQLPTTQIERGWMNTNAISIIDIPAKKFVTSVLLDDLDLGDANPWDVAITPDGKTLCISHAGSQELSIIDRLGMHEKIAKLLKGEGPLGPSATITDVPNDLTFLLGLRRRVHIEGNGPRGLAVAGSKVYASEYFTDSLAVYDLSSSSTSAHSVALGPKVPMTARRKGEMLFSDAEMCLQKWQSCISCHPDARSDGLNWDLMNDGIGNPKNTKSMFLSHKTPPVMITGIRENAEKAVRSGMRFILFVERPESDSKAIDEYLKSMPKTPSPYLVNGKMSATAKRGAAVFAKAGCASCHSGTYFTDMKKHEVGTGIGQEKGLKFDTPTLVECWRTAPYLYDGRAVTMKEVLTKFNSGDRHGRTSKLSAKQISDLAEYVLSL